MRFINWDELIETKNNDIKNNQINFRYFVAKIIGFSFHKALCKIADPKSPLHECDIGGNKEVGQKLA